MNKPITVVRTTVAEIHTTQHAIAVEVVVFTEGFVNLVVHVSAIILPKIVENLADHPKAVRVSAIFFKFRPKRPH